MQLEHFQQLVTDAAEDVKALELCWIDVRERTSITDLMLICSGTSTRHINAIAQNIWKQAKAAGVSSISMEGESESEWILVDLGDILVHVMLPHTRSFYDLEKLWQAPPRATNVDDEQQTDPA